MSKGTGTAPDNLGGTAIKPVGWDRTGLEAFRYLLYNPDTGEVLTRTPLSWLKITVFYTIYYCFLAFFWLGCLNIFFLTLPHNAEGPKWKMNNGIIGENPGVGLRPVNTYHRIDSQMFVLKQEDTDWDPSNGDGEGNKNIDYAVRQQRFLQEYDFEASGGYQPFDLASLGPCGEYPYGFVGEEVAPCIVVKLNRIWDWVPEPIEEYDLDYLPYALKDHWVSQNDKNNIWINCDGRYAADKEALRYIEYFPSSRGLPIKYFPYLGTYSGNYHSPLVAIKISPASIGQLIHVECRAYYRGVMHDTKNKMGLVQFEVLFTEY